MSKPTGFFNPQDLEDLLNGAVFLASGGGGARDNGNALKDAILEVSEQVAYIDPTQVDPKQFASVIAAMGAPEKFKESGFTHAPLRSFNLLEEAKKKNFPESKETAEDYAFSYIVPVETGVIAHMMSMLVAVQKNIAVVDGDGGGRAFPSLAMSTFACDGITVAPGALVTEKSVATGGTEVVLNLKNPVIVDDLSRALLNTTEFNDVASLACFAMNGATMQKVVIPNTLTKARNLGSLIRKASNPVEAIVKALEGYILFAGGISDIQETTQVGFDFGTVVIENESGAKVYVLNQNENVIAWSDQKAHPIALAPDPICYITPDGMTLSNADLQKGQEVVLIGLKAPDRLRVPYFINIFKQVYEQVFQYHGPYVPIEQLQNS